MRSKTRGIELSWQLTAAAWVCLGCSSAPTSGAEGAATGSSGTPSTPAMTSDAGGTKATGNASAGTTAPATTQTSKPAVGGTTAVAQAGAAGPTKTAAGAPAANAAAGTVAMTSAGANAEQSAAAGGGAVAAGGVQCPMLKATTTEARLHMHHIHWNTQDPTAAAAFVDKYFKAATFDYCKDAAGQATQASKTERAYFLYTKVNAPPTNQRLNRLAHVGYINADVAGELKRLNDLKVPLADSSVCATAAMGTPCNTGPVQWFYVDMPESGRFEIATGPGPATSGFGHIHLVMPDYSFFQKVLGDALQDPNGNPNVDQVNMVASGRTGVLDTTITYQDTKGAAVDHVGFSTGDLEGTQKRIEAAGIKIEEPISFKPEFGFRSFMVRSNEGIWLEILEGDGFKP